MFKMKNLIVILSVSCLVHLAHALSCVTYNGWYDIKGIARCRHVIHLKTEPLFSQLFQR